MQTEHLMTALAIEMHVAVVILLTAMAQAQLIADAAVTVLERVRPGRLGDRDLLGETAGGRTAADDYLLTAKHFDVAVTFNKPIDIQQFREKVVEIIKSHQ